MVYLCFNPYGTGTDVEGQRNVLIGFILVVIDNEHGLTACVFMVTSVMVLPFMFY